MKDGVWYDAYLRNKWTFLIDVGSSTLDCSLMGRGLYNVYTLVDTEVYPFGIDNCVRQLAEQTRNSEPKIKSALFLSDLWLDSNEYIEFRKILANKIMTTIKEFFTKSGIPKQFIINFSSSDTGRPGPTQIDILYCIFGGGAKSPFFMSFLTTGMRKSIVLRETNMNLNFVHTSTPENFLPPTIDKNHGGRFLVALGLFENVSNIHVNRMGTVSPARK